MQRLVLAVNDPRRFAAILAEFANCAGCSMAVIAQFAYEMAGFALQDSQDDNVPALPCTCEHPAIAEIVAMRLALSYANADEDVLALTLAQMLDCRACMASTIMALVRGHVGVLDTTKLPWQNMFERHLLTLLDESSEGR